MKLNNDEKNILLKLVRKELDRTYPTEQSKYYIDALENLKRKLA